MRQSEPALDRRLLDGPDGDPAEMPNLGPLTPEEEARVDELERELFGEDEPEAP